MHYAAVLLWRAQVAGIFEGHPGVARFENHPQHFPPQILCFQRFMELELSVSSHLLVVLVAFFKRFAVQIVQIGHVIGREQGPVTIFEHPLHEQVRDPVGGVHVVRPPAIVPGILSQVEKLLDIHVPGFEVGADGPLSLAALIDGDCCVINDLQEGDNALTFTVGTFDVGAKRPDRRPVIAQSPGKLGQHGVVLNSAIYAKQVIGHCRQVA